MAWVFIAGWASTLVTVIALLWLTRTTLAEASGLLIAMLASGTAPVTTYAYGRTAERRARVAPDDGGFPPLDHAG